jgi:hypothetical protein
MGPDPVGVVVARAIAHDAGLILAPFAALSLAERTDGRHLLMTSRHLAGRGARNWLSRRCLVRRFFRILNAVSTSPWVVPRCSIKRINFLTVVIIVAQVMSLRCVTAKGGNLGWFVESHLGRVTMQEEAGIHDE